MPDGVQKVASENNFLADASWLSILFDAKITKAVPSSLLPPLPANKLSSPSKDWARWQCSSEDSMSASSGIVLGIRGNVIILARAIDGRSETNGMFAQTFLQISGLQQLKEQYNSNDAMIRISKYPKQGALYYWP